jgi:hypothetical protein
VVDRKIGVDLDRGPAGPASASFIVDVLLATTGEIGLMSRDSRTVRSLVAIAGSTTPQAMKSGKASAPPRTTTQAIQPGHSPLSYLSVATFTRITKSGMIDKRTATRAPSSS